MAGFREENRFLICSTSIYGLYMFSIENFVTNKCVLGFLTVWTKLPVILLLLVVGLDFRATIFDEMDVLERFALGRKVLGTFSFLLKNIFFYKDRRKIEKLIDLWDDSFKQEFYPEKNLIFKEKSRKENKRITTILIILGTSAAVFYAFPSYFSKTKVIKHPTGLIYPHSSPGFEIAVTFDLFVSIMSVSSKLFDCILLIFLYQVRSKVVFLKETLQDILNELIIDDEGRLLGRRINGKVGFWEYGLRSNDDQTVISSPCQEEVYEERDRNSKEYRQNIANIETKLRIWILQHQQIIAFFEELSKVYSSLSTFELGYNVLYTGMTALNVVQMKISFIALGTVLVASSNLLSLFLWCRVSEELKTVDLFGGSFNRAWFLLPRKVKTALSFIIMRSRKPLSLYGFSLFAINLTTFFEILKLAYQFFAFMVQMSDENSGRERRVKALVCEEVFGTLMKDVSAGP